MLKLTNCNCVKFLEEQSSPVLLQLLLGQFSRSCENGDQGDRGGLRLGRP